MFSPQIILENNLTKLSEILIPSSEDLEEGKRNATKLFELFKQRSNFRIDRVGVFGSIEKKTSIKVDFDFDCVIFVNDVLPPYEDIIDDFENVLILYGNRKMWDISTTSNSIRVIIDNIKFDVVPATNFSHDIVKQREQAMNKIRNLENPSRQGYKYSSSMAETQVEFIRNQSEFAHNFIRLAKYWNKTLFITTYLSGRSSMIEMIALYIAKAEEKIYPTVSILRAFRNFLESMTHLNDMKIIFEDYYKINDINDIRINDILEQRPLVLDPSNPFNNLAHPLIQNQNAKEIFQKFAMTTLDRIDRGFSNYCFNRIFDPQPAVAPIEEVKKSLPSVKIIDSWIFTIKEEKSDKSPSIIIRNEEKTDKLGVEIVKHYLSKNINVLNNDIKTKHEMDELIKRIISDTIYNETFIKWSATDKKHEDYHVTFIIPTKNFMVTISTKWD